MSLLIDTDDEMNRYDEAALYAKTVKPDLAPGIRSSFNVDTGQTDLMAPLPSGGFVKLGSQAPEITVEAPDVMMTAPAMPGMGADAALPVEDDEFQLQSIKNFAASGANISSRDDYLAAGYSDQLIDASGVMGETQQKTGRTEPLSVGEIKTILREGGTLLQDYTPTMRENGSADLMETLMEISVDRRREELLEQMKKNGEADDEALNFKIDQVIASERPEMLSLAENLTDAVFGNKNVLGTGVADFVTAGVMDMQEGYRMLEAGSSFNGGSATQRGLGILLIAAGVAEATGVGMLLGKAIKASIPKIQSAMVSMGQNAELRIKERGTGTTLNMGGDPMALTDPLVAAAGRAVGGDRVAEIKTQMRQIQDERRLNNNLARNGELIKLKRELKEIDQSGDGNFSIVEPPTDDTPGIIAFHGSAADFDGFKLEKIGTGEGAQAYGYGLYFADSEEIAKFYKESLTEVPADYQIDGQSVSAMYDQAINNQNYELAEVLEQVQLHDAPKDLKERFTIDGGYSQETQDFVRDLDYDSLTGVNPDGKEIELGRVYKVALTPKPEDLLDYDKPLSEQPKILSAIDKVHGDSEIIITQLNLDPATATGGQLIDALAGIVQTTESKKAAAEWMEKAGIPGIKFFDNTSRNTADGKLIDVSEADDGFRAKVAVDNRAGGLGGSGRIVTTSPPYKTKQEALDWADKSIGKKSSNYVIFDDSMIKILEKYGIVGPVAISAMALSEDES